MCTSAPSVHHSNPRRNVSVSSDVSEYYDAADHDHLDEEELSQHLARGIDWEDEAQMLPGNERSEAERLQLIHSMRKIVLAQPDTGAQSSQGRSMVAIGSQEAPARDCVDVPAAEREEHRAERWWVPHSPATAWWLP